MTFRCFRRHVITALNRFLSPSWSWPTTWCDIRSVPTWFETSTITCSSTRHFGSTRLTRQVKLHSSHVITRDVTELNLSVVQVQAKLFKYLATVFIEDANIYNTIRRVTSVITTLHTIKYFYWIVNPADRSGIAPKGVGNSLWNTSKTSEISKC